MQSLACDEMNFFAEWPAAQCPSDTFALVHFVSEGDWAERHPAKKFISSLTISSLKRASRHRVLHNVSL
jgi:hypothetical protein